MSETLLRTKLYVPPLRPTLVSRSRLLERLEQSLGSGRGLILVSAPAGFGKTTLLSEWAHEVQANSQQAPDSERRLVWLSLDERDNEPARFLTYLVTALSEVDGVDPAVGQAALRLLQSAAAPPEAILTALINDMATTTVTFILVLDDYHLIDSPTVDGALAFLLENMPPRLHVVLATRADPNLPLARYRARAQLSELRATDLRFNVAETAEFLNRTTGLQLNEDDIVALESRTEGWVASLQLLALALQGSLPQPGAEDISTFIRSFTGSHRYVLDYLIDEVLTRQPQPIQEFLQQTAFLEPLTASLCDAVRFGVSETADGGAPSAPAEDEDSQTILERLERANLFVIPLDGERRWYRYHHLFADVLQTRLRTQAPDQVALLHRRASHWYERHERPAEAIHHALAAQDFRRAAELAELAWPEWRESYRALAWLGWVRELPAALVRARPVLSLAFAWAYLSAGELEAAEEKLVDVEGYLEARADADGLTPNSDVVDKAQWQALPASLAMAQAYLAQAMGHVQETAIHVNRALKLLPAEDHYNRAGVSSLLGLAYWANGDLEAAYQNFSEGLFQSVHNRITGTFVLAEMLTALGRLPEAVDACERALQLAAKCEDPYPLGTEDVYTALAELQRERGDLEGAARHLETARKLGEEVVLPDWRYRWCMAQAQLQQCLGQSERSLVFLNEAEHVYVRTPLPLVRPIGAMKARVWIRQGRLAEAGSWLRRQQLAADDELSYLREYEHITMARLHLAQSQQDPSDGSLTAARVLLGRLHDAARAGGRVASIIEISVLQALACHAQGVLSAALRHLEEALALAEPAGFVRVFVDEGEPMTRLLEAALQSRLAPDYVRSLLAEPFTRQTGPVQAGPTPEIETGLLEPLSERELEVLQLIAAGLSNRDIAGQLFVSLNTIKAHTRNIYGKLGVHSRTQAVTRGREVGILPLI